MPYDPLEMLGKIDPEMMKRLREQDEFVYADGALPRKVKLLIAMAFDAAHGASGGVRGLAGRAKKAGASDQEIAEALRVAAHLSGVGALYTASIGLKEAE
ncbi:MAG: carboxymuconolactone decarboxylase family protein [Spirochaetia bacterium]|jgi:alkylhydroperoxidase/carboxymuconolactone decarboxylase family protein YurZ